jgi:hypothetical protein
VAGMRLVALSRGMSISKSSTVCELQHNPTSSLLLELLSRLSTVQFSSVEIVL